MDTNSIALTRKLKNPEPGANGTKGRTQNSVTYRMKNSRLITNTRNKEGENAFNEWLNRQRES